MSLLTLKDHEIVLDPHSLAIPAMRKIWDRDKTKGKHKAYKELLYTYYVCDFKSPYANYETSEREAKVVSDIMEKDWAPDEELKLLIAEYKDHQVKNSPSLALLMASSDAVHKLAGWLRNVSYEGEDAMDPSKVAKTLGEVSKIIDTLNKLEDKVKQEITTTSRARGGGVEGLYEG
jgi:hypothetical protein